MAFVRLVRNMESDAGSQIREFRPQNFLRPFDDDVPTRPGSNTPKNKYVFEFLEVGVVRKTVAQVSANRLINLARTIVTLLHQTLDVFQLLRQ